MKHHVMLTFLSDVKAKSANEIRTTRYEGDIGLCYTTNESAIRYEIKQEHHNLEKIFVFASRKVREDLITYRDTKDNKTVVYHDKDGKSWTHLEYFVKRVAPILPDCENCIDIEEYDEKAEIKSNMNVIVAMAKKIRQYVQKLPYEDSLVLHVDFTGGMRHAAMIMMVLTRLLQYDKRVQIGDIVYSNYEKQIVEKANDIYDLFSLAAGAEEFVRFGSIQTLKDYYKEKSQSPALQALLEAMEAFAEAINLCHYGEFKKAVSQLRGAVNYFSQHEEKVVDEEVRLNDAFMDSLYNRIYYDYKDLLEPEEPDDLTLILWCVSHSYLQQALTLYTERIPEILISKGIVSLTESGEKAFIEQFKNDNSGTSEAFKICNKLYDKHMQEAIDKKKAAYCSELRKCLKMLQQQEVRPENVFDVLQSTMESLFTGIPAAFDDEDLLKRRLKFYQELYTKPKITWEAYKDNSIFQSIQVQCVKNREMDLKKFENLPAYKKGKAIATFMSQMDLRNTLEFFSDIHIPYSERMMTNVENGWVRSAVSPDTLRQIMEQYYKIKNERNHTNHARLDSTQWSTKDICDEIKLGIEQIRDIC